MLSKSKKVRQIECESSTESLVSSDDDFYVGLITANQPENNESDYDDLHSLIDSDDKSDDENDDFDDQPDVDFVHSTSGVSNSVQENNNTSSDESESYSNGTHTDIKPVNDLCDIIDPNNADYEPEDINTEIFSVDSDPSQKRDWTIYLNTNGTDVDFKIDLGAQVNILPKMNSIDYVINPLSNLQGLNSLLIMVVVFEYSANVLPKLFIRTNQCMFCSLLQTLSLLLYLVGYQ